MKMKLLKRLYDAIAAARTAALAAIVALGLAGLMAGPAMALSVDQTRIFNARGANQKVTYFRISVNFNDTGIGLAQQFAMLPPNAYIILIDAYVNTAFNAASTNVITIGTTKANSNEIVASGITAGTIGVYHLTSAAGLGTGVSMGGTCLARPCRCS